MKTDISAFLVMIFIITAFSCKSKPAESTGSENQRSAAEIGASAKSQGSDAEQSVDTPKRVETTAPEPPLFEKLDHELFDALALLPQPKKSEDYNVHLSLRRKTLERKKDLLLSVPISPQTHKACEEAWETLMILNASGFFNDSQEQFVRDLIFRHSGAPQLDRLVIWRLIKLRMESVGKRGSGVSEDILKEELAKFLLVAFGIDKSGLFEAMKPATRVVNEETGRAGYQAEEEILRIYSEQSKKAEKILKDHFKQTP